MHNKSKTSIAYILKDDSYFKPVLTGCQPLFIDTVHSSKNQCGGDGLYI